MTLMTPGARRRFDAVSTREEWGVADATGFHLHESPRDALEGFPFVVCRIDGRQVAVFVEMDVPVEVRAEVAPRKPDWLDAVVYARVISAPRAAVAVIEAHAPSPDDADLDRCAFAAVCVAYGVGSFKVAPTSYVVRFEGRAAVLVRVDFDDDSESWFGEAAADLGDTR